jgi:NitT/TauT family transport system substrate-binding protein
MACHICSELVAKCRGTVQGIRNVILAVGAAWLLLGAPTAAQDAEPTPFFMTFVPNVQFAQMYIGMEKGYFADAGFDLALEYGNEPDGVELIALGQYNWGLIAGEQIIVARANERPVVSVYEWWQANPVAIVTSADSGIESPADLAGRRVGVPGRFGASYSGLVALLNANSLTESDIDLQEIGFNAPEVMCVGGVEAATVYGNNEPLQIARRVEAGDCDAVSEVRVFNVVDEADLVSNGLVTNEALIANQPERVAAMVAAYDMAVADVVNNPFEAYLLVEPYIENLPLSDDLRAALEAAAAGQAAFLADGPTREAVAAQREAVFAELGAQFPADELLQLDVLLETVKLWDAEQLGFAEASSWELTQDTLVQMGFIENTIDVETAFTNDFLPE